MIAENRAFFPLASDSFHDHESPIPRGDLDDTEVEASPLMDPGYIALIDTRVLERECLAHTLRHHQIDRKVMTFSDMAEWRRASGDIGLPCAVLFNAGNMAVNGEELVAEIANMVEAVSPAAVIILSDDQEINAILKIIALGVNGYIPSSISIEVCIQAISLAIAGGRFIPASSLLGIQELLGFTAAKTPSVMEFTNRQSAVAEALRCGKANKDIASELNLCESTIKVHIRNIMKKLGATNRAEVASKIGGMTMLRQ